MCCNASPSQVQGVALPPHHNCKMLHCLHNTTARCCTALKVACHASLLLPFPQLCRNSPPHMSNDICCFVLDCQRHTSQGSMANDCWVADGCRPLGTCICSVQRRCYFSLADNQHVTNTVPDQAPMLQMHVLSYDAATQCSRACSLAHCYSLLPFDRASLASPRGRTALPRSMPLLLFG